jgi:two-component system, OmpR family, copper resistance phosphate regulon response regulator CusR
MNILIIEDERKVSSFLKNGLEEQKYVVDQAYDGLSGERLAMKNRYDIILMDVIIPGLNGLDLCKKIKLGKPEIPILMLTALGTTDDKVIGFESGADDYLVKPFEFKELLARIKALTKRARPTPAAHPANITLKVADLELDVAKKIAYRAGQTIFLTAKEFGLLEFLLRNKGNVMSRQEIGQHVWEVSFDSEKNVVEVYVNILRKKIDRDFPVKLIQTRIGHGYVIQEP